MKLYQCVLEGGSGVLHWNNIKAFKNDKEARFYWNKFVEQDPDIFKIVYLFRIGVDIYKTK